MLCVIRVEKIQPATAWHPSLEGTVVAKKGIKYKRTI